MSKIPIWSLPFFFGFVIFQTCVGGSAFAQIPTHVWVGTGPELRIAYDDRYSPKAQIGMQGQAGVITALSPTLSLSAGMEIAYTYPTNIDGGFLYRGFSALTPFIYVDVHEGSIIHASSGIRRFLFSGGIEASVAQYALTDNYYFFLSAAMTSSILFVPGTSQRWMLRLSLPVKYHFNKALAFFMSFGLSCSLMFDISLNFVDIH